ncbi:hypothetical protein [Roseovarius sp. EL26]|uniref:hypothetical protein n=1 Tax=Roseovarius sp. EL26 TaxID=2126672 RepID=UPI000EA2643E
MKLETGDDFAEAGRGADTVNAGKGNDVVYGDIAADNLLAGDTSTGAFTPSQFGNSDDWSTTITESCRQMS